MKNKEGLMEEKSEMVKELDKDYEDYCQELKDIFEKEFREKQKIYGYNTHIEPNEYTSKPLWKEKGSSHYKSGKVEPIDLYKAGGMFQDFALCSIIKYAFRNRKYIKTQVSPSDMDKIIHYAEILKGGG